MEQKGFFGRLFDTSFSEYITPSIIKVIFIIGVLLAGIAAILLLFGGVRGGGMGAVLSLVIAPIAFVLYVIGVRISCELIIIMFRICDNTSKLAGEKAPAASTETGDSQ